jgi:molecular chaperone DnaK (HSP70)
MAAAVGDSVSSTSITVPQYFDMFQRLVILSLAGAGMKQEKRALSVRSFGPFLN